MIRKQLLFTALSVFALVNSTRAQQGMITFHISPDGNDLNAGTPSAPFQSLEKAKRAVRLQRIKTPGSPVVVYLHGGNYHLESPVVFTSEDAGKDGQPVIYKAADGEQPVFSGSRELKDWRLLKDPGKLKLLPPEVKGKIYVCDIRAAGIRQFGDPTEVGKRPEMFCNGILQTLARWPNTGFIKSGVARGKTRLPENYTGKHGTAEGIFEYINERQNRWAAEKDIRLGGYWYWDWSDEYQKVDKMDTQKKLIFLREPYHHYGYKDSLRYFGLNLFRELDMPGEWYLDRTDG